MYKKYFELPPFFHPIIDTNEIVDTSGDSFSGS